MVGNLHRIDRYRIKIGLIPNFLGYSNSPWTGTNMHTWFYWQNNFCGKVPAFLKSHMGNKKTQENLFPCSYALQTNRFTFEKNPPPPPLLHPNMWILKSGLCEAVVILKKHCIATVVWMHVGHVTRSYVNTHTYCCVNVTCSYVNTHTYCCVMCVGDMTHWCMNAHTHIVIRMCVGDMTHSYVNTHMYQDW